MDALERFRKEFKRWVNAHNRAKNFNSDPDEILERIEQKIPEAMLRQIGGAYINGWLRNENGQDRGYFVKETDRKQTQKGSLHDQVMENEGVTGTIERRLQKIKRVTCREAVSSIQIVYAMISLYLITKSLSINL